MEASREALFRLDDYDYDLPPELIAQFPVPGRDQSRLLVLNRLRNTLEHSRFGRIAEYLNRGDLLVVNDTRVVPARLIGHKKSGGRTELLVLDPYKSPETGAAEGYCCLVKSSKGVKVGQRIHFKEGLCAEVAAPLGDGKAMVRFPSDCCLLDALNRIGEVPLPPYVERGPGMPPVDDRTCYQTEFARVPGAVAAPTAGLHFSKQLLETLNCGGIAVASITLHVGYGTFAPIRCEDIREHRIHSEYVELSEETAEAVNRAKREGRRVVAVGTTVVRSLEWIYAGAGKIVARSGMCGHYIYPGYRFGVVDCMVTNFHLPKSSLILLVSAFAGRDRVLSAYHEAIRERYRFFSYGDATLIV
ncbi:MAG: tRNA preQ1(34) S-adenosylmethionine ribosyltransferase-isomerase QueA [Syntrophobacteraceae bacterium]